MNYRLELFFDNIKSWFTTQWQKLKYGDRKKQLIIGGYVVLIAIIIVLLCLLFRGCSGTSISNGRRNAGNQNSSAYYVTDENGNLIPNKKPYENALKLAKKYADKGEYDRALGLLEQILIENPDDEKVRELFDQYLDLKHQAEEKAARENAAGYSINPNISVDMNTESLSSELQRALDRQAAENQRALERALSEGNRQNSESQKALERALSESQRQAAESQKAFAELMEKQAAQDEAKKAEEAERKAAEKAAEIQRKAEEEKRRKAEEELAKKNAKLKSEIDAVNEKIRLGKASLHSGDVDGALGYFQEARDLLPVSEGEPEFTASKESEMAMALFEAAGKSGDRNMQVMLMNEAVKCASNALSSNPKDPSSNFILGSDAQDKRDLNKAQDYLKKAVMYDPNNYLYYYNLGKVQYGLKKYSEAQSSFSTSCRLKDDFTPSRFNLGLTYVMLKNDNQALNSFRKTLDIDPRYEKAYQEEARILRKRGDYAGAISSYKKAIDINNTNETYHLELGSVYYADEKFSLAEESYRRALALIESDANKKTRVNYPRACNNLSTSLFDQGKYSDALTYAKKAYDLRNLVRDDREKANMIYNYALLLEKNKDSDSAILVYSEVLKYDPNHIKTNINLGVIYMGLTPPDAESALVLFNKVYETDKLNFEANNNLGNAYVELEQFDNAIIHYQNALKIDSKNNEVRYNLAKAYAKNGDYNNAKLVYMDLVKQDNRHWDGYLELAKVCLQLNENENAEKYLVYLQDKNPGFKVSEIQALLDGLSQ